MTDLFWIKGPWKGRLAIAARPRGGDWLHEELSDWRNAGINQVVSLLTSRENAALELRAEESACQNAGIRFVSFPIEDRSVPPDSIGALGLVHRLDADLSGGAKIVIHCRQGVGRAGMIATGVLITRGFDADLAIQEVSAARGVPVPETDEQRDWICGFISSGAREDPPVPSHL